MIPPSELSLDDMQPTVLLAHELTEHRIPRNTTAVAFSRVGDSHIELIDAKLYMNQADCAVLSGAIPERIAYRRARDEGRALTETRHPLSMTVLANLLRASPIES